MGTAASVLACALSVLGRIAGEHAPDRAHRRGAAGGVGGAEAFVRRDMGTIYVITSSVGVSRSGRRRLECRETHVTESSPASSLTKSGTCATEPMRNRRTNIS